MKTSSKLIITLSIAGSFWLNCYLGLRLYRAEICNKAFVLWFHHNQGVDINLDIFFQDAVKWVNDPQYQ